MRIIVSKTFFKLILIEEWICGYRKKRRIKNILETINNNVVVAKTTIINDLHYTQFTVHILSLGITTIEIKKQHTFYFYIPQNVSMH